MAFEDALSSALKRSETYKLLGRGRLTVALEQVMRVRMLIRWRAATELGT